MMVIYLPVKFEFDWANRFRVRNGNVDGQTNKRNYTNFERNLAMMVIYLPVKFGQTNGQTRPLPQRLSPALELVIMEN